MILTTMALHSASLLSRGFRQLGKGLFDVLAMFHCLLPRVLSADKAIEVGVYTAMPSYSEENKT